MYSVGHTQSTAVLHLDDLWAPHLQRYGRVAIYLDISLSIYQDNKHHFEEYAEIIDMGGQKADWLSARRLYAHYQDPAYMLSILDDYLSYIEQYCCNQLCTCIKKRSDAHESFRSSSKETVQL